MEQIEEAQAAAEAEAILQGPPPENPPPPEAAAHDVILPSFDRAIKTLANLHTKPLDKFSGTGHEPYGIHVIGDFLHEVARAIDRLREQRSEAPTTDTAARAAPPQVHG